MASQLNISFCSQQNLPRLLIKNKSLRICRLTLTLIVYIRIQLALVHQKCQILYNKINCVIKAFDALQHG